jgi:uncharacterized protein YukJ
MLCAGRHQNNCCDRCHQQNGEWRDDVFEIHKTSVDRSFVQSINFAFESQSYFEGSIPSELTKSFQ